MRSVSELGKKRESGEKEKRQEKKKSNMMLSTSVFLFFFFFWVMSQVSMTNKGGKLTFDHSKPRISNLSLHHQKFARHPQVNSPLAQERQVDSLPRSPLDVFVELRERVSD